MGKYAKAVVAALTTFGASFTTAIQDGSVGGSAVVSNEWVLIVVGTAISAVAVWAVPNSPTNV